MAGHYRVAAPDAQVGQPEVNLGIIPAPKARSGCRGWSGVEKALEMCVSGKPIKAPEALAAGLVDRDHRGRPARRAPWRSRDDDRRTRRTASAKTRERTDRLARADAHAALFAAARELAAQDPPPSDRAARGHRRHRSRGHAAVRRGLPARARAVRRVRRVGAGQGAHPRVLRRARGGEGARASRKDVVARTVATVAIVGAGTMGGGIAMACANAGIDRAC